jgi:hypothetical protein
MKKPSLSNGHFVNFSRKNLILQANFIFIMVMRIKKMFFESFKEVSGKLNTKLN